MIKKQKLDVIEEAAMVEEDPVKLDLFEQYREEYMQQREARDNGDTKKVRAEATEQQSMREMASGSGGPAAYTELEVSAILEVVGDPWDITENAKLWSSDAEASECLNTFEDQANADTAKLWICDDGEASA
jgi:hypothetical protein